MQFTPKLDLAEEYSKYKNVLKGAKKGEVVTRFAPEPSGYLHIGHVKAALITYHYAKMYDGKMLLRFDDTNPSKEKTEFVESIQEDLRSLGINWDKMSYTSDHFEYFEKEAIKLIEQGLAYCDNTPVEQMREERTEGIESKFRNSTVEENLKIFKGMKTATDPAILAKKAEDKKKAAQKGHAKKTDGKEKEEDTTDYSAFCLRAKISMDNKNKCMRDPVLYRCNFTPHHRTGSKYKMYPTYDFACPLIDALEGVTHAMRSMEYTDRVAQYNWVIKKCNVRNVNIFEFSRLGFVNVVLSKRKLQWFVDTKRVDGWDDARMPTVRGILRRGLRVSSLTQFMLAQGPSKNYNLMEWDKIWAVNKKLIDPVCPRFTCIKKDKVCNLLVLNGPEEIKYNTAPWNPIREAAEALKAQRPVAISKNVILDFDDVQNIKVGEKITLMKWGNVVIKSKEADGDAFKLTAEHLPDDKDFGKTVQKISWLSKDADLVDVNLIELNHLIKVNKLEEDQNLEDVINETTKYVTQYLADPLLRQCRVDDALQFERRGYYRVEDVKLTKGGDKVYDLIYTPDGKQQAMTANLTSKVDAKSLMVGEGKSSEQKTKDKKDAKQAQKDSSSNAQKQDKKADKKAKDNSNQTQLFSVQGNFRSNMIEIAADITNQQIAKNYIGWKDLKSKENVSRNPQGQVPYLQTKEGYLYQTSACLRYIASRSQKIKLYGSNEFEKASIDQWIDFTNSDLSSSIRPLLLHIWGWKEASEQEIKDAHAASGRFLTFLDANLKGKDFLVGNTISIADIMLYCNLVNLYRTIFNADIRKKYSNITAWYEKTSENKSIQKFYRKNQYSKEDW